jgi:hypothetical protein
MNSESWRIQANWPAGTFRVTAPDGTVYEVGADLETTQVPSPRTGCAFTGSPATACCCMTAHGSGEACRPKLTSW